MVFKIKNKNRTEKRRDRNRRRVKNIILFSFILVVLAIVFLKVVTNKLNSDYKIKDVREVSLLVSNDNVADKFTVCIDPGHGDWDVGCIGITGLYEKDIVLDISIKLGKLLENEGINVVYTRNTDNLTLSDDSTENLYERVQICEESNSDVFISIHCNSAGYLSECRGVETWYNNKSYNSEVFATAIQEELISLNYTDDRGIKFYNEDEPLAVLNNNTVPAALVELGFISNWSDESYLNSEYGQVAIAEAICDAIVSYKDNINI